MGLQPNDSTPLNVGPYLTATPIFSYKKRGKATIGVSQILYTELCLHSYTTIAVNPLVACSSGMNTCKMKSALTGVISGGDPPMPKLEGETGQQ